MKKNYRNNKERNRGFTLLEIIIGLTIIGLLVGGGMANYWKLEQRKAIEGGAKEAEQAVRDAQKQAAAGVKPDNPACNSPQTLVAYRLEMIGNSSDTELIAICSGGEVPVLKKKLSGGAVYTYSKYFEFDLLGNSLRDDSNCVQDAGGSNIYLIKVTEGGSVSFQREAGACSADVPSGLPAGVFLNEASGNSCTDICQSEGYSGCSSIGINTNGTGNIYKYRLWIFCLNFIGDCATVMNESLFTDPCSLIKTRWTYCKCAY